MTYQLTSSRRAGRTIHVASSEEDFAVSAADQVQRQLRARADSVLALPSGKTPVTLYEELSRRCREGEISFADVRTFNLDEFVGVPSDHPASFETYMMTHLFSHIDIDMANVHMPDGRAPSLEQSCQTYERTIAAAGGIDLAIVGIGGNGHIAFNEPGTPFESRTHVVDLTPATLEAHAQDFGGLASVPPRAMTMGIGTIMQARRILFLARGADKADIVARAVEGPVTREVPASALQTHPNVLILLDREAARRLHVGT